ncbi:MAG: rhomboid family intramembrane serine protease [Methyloligellaceae bacterium]
MTTRQPMFNVPASVLAAIGAVLIVHGVRALLPADLDVTLLLTLAFIPGRYVASAPALPGGEISAVTSLFTYMLVHGDLTHLLVNSIWMLAFGSAVAKRIGGLRFWGFSILCGLAGAVAHLAFHFGELVPVVGASAAISGQMAGALRFMASAGTGVLAFGGGAAVPLASVWDTLRNPQILLFMAVWAGLNAIFGLGYLEFQGGGGGIAWEAHIGGFLCGLLIFGLFDPQNRRLDPQDGPPEITRIH